MSRLLISDAVELRRWQSENAARTARYLPRL